MLLAVAKGAELPCHRQGGQRDHAQHRHDQCSVCVFRKGVLDALLAELGISGHGGNFFSHRQWALGSFITTLPGVGDLTRSPVPELPPGRVSIRPRIARPTHELVRHEVHFYIQVHVHQLVADRRLQCRPMQRRDLHWKGAAKPNRVPAAGEISRAALTVPDAFHPGAGRATAGSMVRQRNMRRKPLYLGLLPSLVGWSRGAKATRTGSVQFSELVGAPRRAWRGVISPIPSSCVARGIACHLRARR